MSPPVADAPPRGPDDTPEVTEPGPGAAGPEARPAVVAPWVVAALLVGLAAGITAVAVWGARNDGARVTIRVPDGTAARVERGEDPEVVDEVLWLQVGDRVTLVNDDVVLHQLGPLAAGPGERARTTFDEPVRIDGSTSLRPTGTVTIVVRPRNAPEPVPTTRSP